MRFPCVCAVHAAAAVGQGEGGEVPAGFLVYSMRFSESEVVV